MRLWELLLQMRGACSRNSHFTESVSTVPVVVTEPGRVRIQRSSPLLITVLDSDSPLDHRPSWINDATESDQLREPVRREHWRQESGGPVTR